MHLWDRGRDIGRFIQRASGAPNPAPPPAKLAGSLISSSDPVHQPPVELPDQTQAQGKGSQLRQAILHSLDVVEDLTDIRHARLLPGDCLEKE